MPYKNCIYVKGLSCLLENECNKDCPAIKVAQNEKPKLGLVPKRIHNQQRAEDIQFSIMANFENEKPIPIEWVEEYNELVGELNAL